MNNRIRRINLYGGPCSSKSTNSAWLFSELKQLGKNVELVQEYCKFYSYVNRQIKPFDQIHFLGKQIDREYRLLLNGVSLIITDCPVMLGAFYTQYYFQAFNIHNPIIDIALKFDDEFSPLNIFLDRKDKPYKELGRKEDYATAQEIDKFMKQKLDNIYGLESYHIIDYNDRQKLLKLVLENI